MFWWLFGFELGLGEGMVTLASIVALLGLRSFVRSITVLLGLRSIVGLLGVRSERLGRV